MANVRPGCPATTASVSKQQLSNRRQALLELMQLVNFGRIERLTIKDGEPVFDPPPHVVREVKFGGENGPRPEAGAVNFLVKAQVLALFRQFDDLHCQWLVWEWLVWRCHRFL